MPDSPTRFVGGPLDGRVLPVGSERFVKVPVPGPAGFSAFVYRKLTLASGEVVMVPDGLDGTAAGSA